MADRVRVDTVNASPATDKRPRGEQGCGPRQLRRARLFAGAECEPLSASVARLGRCRDGIRFFNPAALTALRQASGAVRADAPSMLSSYPDWTAIVDDLVEADRKRPLKKSS